MDSPYSNYLIRQFLLAALTKISARSTTSQPEQDRIAEVLAKYTTSPELELQQRAVEFASLFTLGETRVGVLEQMPAPELKATVMGVVSERKPVGSTKAMDVSAVFFFDAYTVLTLYPRPISLERMFRPHRQWLTARNPPPALLPTKTFSRRSSVRPALRHHLPLPPNLKSPPSTTSWASSGLRHPLRVLLPPYPKLHQCHHRTPQRLQQRSQPPSKLQLLSLSLLLRRVHLALPHTLHTRRMG